MMGVFPQRPNIKSTHDKYLEKINHKTNQQQTTPNEHLILSWKPIHFFKKKILFYRKLKFFNKFFLHDGGEIADRGSFNALNIYNIKVL